MVTKIEPIEGSSNIAGIGYDAASRELAVRFRSGTLYRYSDVPPEVAAEFKGAESKGSFFSKQIRGSFDSEKVDEDEQR